MFDTRIILTRLNTDLLALATKSVGTAWVLLASGAAWSHWTSAPRTSDLRTLGLSQMPSSKGELQTAYRRAAKAAHPDAGGSAEAFLAVSKAFERLTRSNREGDAPPSVRKRSEPDTSSIYARKSHIIVCLRQSGGVARAAQLNGSAAVCAAQRARGCETWQRQL